MLWKDVLVSHSIAGYLTSKDNDRGYLLTFDFFKTHDNNLPDFRWVEWNGKQIF